MDLINWFRPRGYFSVMESSYGEVYQEYSFLQYNLAKQQYIELLKDYILLDYVEDLENPKLSKEDLEKYEIRLNNVLEDLPDEVDMVSSPRTGHGHADFSFSFIYFHTSVDSSPIPSIIDRK